MVRLRPVAHLGISVVDSKHSRTCDLEIERSFTAISRSNSHSSTHRSPYRNLEIDRLHGLPRQLREVIGANAKLINTRR